MSLLKDSSAMDPASASAASTSLGQVPSAGASSRGRQGWHRALRHRSFVLGAVLTMLMLGMAAISLVWTPWSPYEVDLAAKLQPLERPKKIAETFRSFKQVSNALPT